MVDVIKFVVPPIQIIFLSISLESSWIYNSQNLREKILPNLSSQTGKLVRLHIPSELEH